MSTPATANPMHRWWQEHSELDALVALVVEALERGSIASAGESLDDLATALEAHFELEETAYFPLVERISPDQRPAVDAARLGHRKIRERLEDLLALVAAGDLRAARAALDVLLERFHTHEAEEGKLIARLEALATS